MERKVPGKRMTSAVQQSIAILRAFLTENYDEYRRLNAGLSREDNPAYAIVLGAAFIDAVDHRFGRDYTAADVSDFVAHARAYDVGPEAISAADAERVIRVALGEENLMSQVDKRTMGSAQTAMLFALVHERDSSVQDLDGLLASAAKQASDYLQRRAS
jgi:hypothetical protein